jgi:hypothetical protein
MGLQTYGPINMDVVDYSWARPSPASIVNAGYGGVMRYLSYEPGKDISHSELADLHGAGLGVGLVWETTADRPLDGYNAGVDDARQANDRADALGWPHIPIAYAIDFGTDGHDCIPYFQGAVSVGRRPVGMYGCYHAVETLATVAGVVSFWQCAAWSGSGTGSGGSIWVPEYNTNVPVSNRTSLFQFYGSVKIDGTDHNQGLAADIDLLWLPGQEVDDLPSVEDMRFEFTGQRTTPSNQILAQWQADTRRYNVFLVHDVRTDHEGEWWACFGIFKVQISPPEYDGWWSSRPDVINYGDREEACWQLAMVDQTIEVKVGDNGQLLGARMVGAVVGPPPGGRAIAYDPDNEDIVEP